MCKSLWVSLAITVLASYGSAIAEEEPSMYDKEMERMETNRRFDKLNLRGNTGFVSDTSRDFLIRFPYLKVRTPITTSRRHRQLPA